MKRIYVQTFDVAEGGTTERLAITALAMVATTAPVLLWRNLVAICLGLARSRLSIDMDGLISRVRAWVVPNVEHAGSSSPGTDEGPLRPELKGSSSMGREVILARDDSNRVILTEFRRFNDDGTRRLRFAGGYLILPQDVRWLVMRRTSTHSGMIREIENGELLDKDDQVVLIETNLGDLDNESAAQAQASAHDRRLSERLNPLTCLVCGRQISEDHSYDVEIDEEAHPYDTGLVHRGCLSPTHRILGVLESELFASNPALTDFDFKTWIYSMKSGQGLFNARREGDRKGPVMIAWNPSNATPALGGYGVAFELEDGETRYAMARGKVQRMSQRQAEQMAKELNQRIQDQHKQGDPYCFDNRGSFGPYSILVSPENPNPSKIIAADAVPVTQGTVSAHSRVENYYAPLFYLTDAKTAQILAIGNAVVLLTDPLRLGAIMENWKQAGISLSVYTTVILANDRDFDLFMRESQRNSMVVAIDPVFDVNGNPIGGFIVRDIDEIIAEKGADKSAP
jgi:hypothetical protein